MNSLNQLGHSVPNDGNEEVSVALGYLAPNGLGDFQELLLGQGCLGVHLTGQPREREH